MTEKRAEHVRAVIRRLPGRLAELYGRSPRTRQDMSPVPRVPAIYLFVEDGEPIYICRTRNLNQRLALHTRPSSSHNSASFAFLLAVEVAVDTGMAVDGASRTELSANPSFSRFFAAAKKRVAAMPVKYLEVADPIEQAILEVYAAECLATRYNDFNTH